MKRKGRAKKWKVCEKREKVRRVFEKWRGRRNEGVDEIKEWEKLRGGITRV